MSSSNLRARSEVRLVEYLAAVERIAVDRKEHDFSPLGIEALARGPAPLVRNDYSEIAQPMHGLGVEILLHGRDPNRPEICDHVAGRESCPSTMVLAYEVCRRGGEFAPVDRGVSL